ncbi:MAG: DNA repair protein RecO [Planctomycetes bacterium]|jgi:DNA repair protein RecO (recombination protein O)|nr:DNA repair protein RecO [Planctomycetota bacterium]
MEETYTTTAIILNRLPFRESDSRIEAYGLDRGKLELVARGTKKLSSKLAGHLEPFNLSRIMVVRGRQFDYVGGAAAEKCFAGLKNDLEKLAAAGRAVRFTAKLIKAGIEDKNIYDLLLSLLLIYDHAGEHNFDPEVFLHYYAFKLSSLLGYRPGLKHCLVCGGQSDGGKYYFDPKQGGVICQNCGGKKSRYSLTITKNSVNLLRFISDNDLTAVLNLPCENSIKTEIKRAISSFTKFNLNLDL